MHFALRGAAPAETEAALQAAADRFGRSPMVRHQQALQAAAASNEAAALAALGTSFQEAVSADDARER